MNATETVCYISILFPCLCVMVNVMCTLKKCLCLDLFVIVVKLCKCKCSTCHVTLISLDINRINTKIKCLYKIMAGQRGQPKYGFGWPDGRLGGLGPAGSTTPE